MNKLNRPEKAIVCFMSAHSHTDKRLILIAFIVSNFPPYITFKIRLSSTKNLRTVGTPSMQRDLPVLECLS